MNLLRRDSGEIDRLSIVEWLELGAALIGLFVDLVAILGIAGLFAADPEPLDAAGSDLLVVWIGFAVFYTLAFLNSFFFRRYRTSPWARPYPLTRKRRLIDREIGTFAGIPQPELWERLLLAALSSAFPLFLFVYVVVGPPTPDSMFETRIGNTAWTSALCALFVFPAVAFAGRAFDMIVAGLATSTHQR